MSPRPVASLLPIALLTALCAACTPGVHAVADAKPAPPAPAAPFTLRLADPVEADGDFRWIFELVVKNLGASGFYADTLTLAIEDIAPGQTRAERVQRPDVSALLPREAALGVGDSVVVALTRIATSERARLTFELRGHYRDEAPRAARLEFETAPGAAWTAHPSRMLKAGERAVETVFVPAEGASGPAPGLLLVHGHASHARLMIPMARRLAARGYAVMLVSMPGYGTSAGPADLGGPATVRAAAAALDALAREPGVDPKRLGAWGLSRGAGVVASLAATRPELRALVLQSGIYDLWAVHRGTRLTDFPATIEAEAGRDSAAWRERSPLLRAGAIRAATLVLHGERDPNVPVGQAHALVAALTAAGTVVESSFSPGGHVLPAALAERAALPFLDQRLRGD